MGLGSGPAKSSLREKPDRGPDTNHGHPDRTGLIWTNKRPRQQTSRPPLGPSTVPAFTLSATAFSIDSLWEGPASMTTPLRC